MILYQHPPSKDKMKDRSCRDIYMIQRIQPRQGRSLESIEKLKVMTSTKFKFVVFSIVLNLGE